MAATKDQVAQDIVAEAKARGHSRDECLAEMSALYQESGWDETIWDGTHVTYGVAQQDGSYPNRFQGAAAQIKAFFDKLDVKRASPGHGDIWLNICWLQQAPNWSSAQYWWDHGRQAYLAEIKSRIATVTPYLDKYWSSGAPAPAAVGYGVPTGSNITYGSPGFPDWVYQLAAKFNVRASTYPGHQETDRNEAGYAPNPQHLNRGIDWAGSVADMQRLAEYLFSIKGELEQVIWWNPDGRKIGVAGGNDVTNTPYYNYAGGYDDHRDHVHTRQSHSLPLPGGAAPAPTVPKPQYTEMQMFGNGSSARTRSPINFLLHTQEADASAESLAHYCDGSNNVSYHYTLRDGILYDVVDTDLASWSVLSANAFTINLCFAGSFAAWSRAQWLQRERDIEIAAYIAVQDCRKYAIPTDVIAPPYHQAAGISDHKYVTQQLHIGDHVDVGNNFPWDVFASYVTKYATNTPTQGDDDLSAEAEALIRAMATKIDRLDAEWTAVKQGPTRSFFAPDQNPVDSPLGFLYNVDGNVWNQQVTWGYLLGVQRAEELVNAVAQNGVVPASWAGQLTDAQGHWLVEWGQQWCVGLISLRAAMQKAFKAAGAAPVVNNAAAPVSTSLTSDQTQEIVNRTASVIGVQIARQVADQVAAQPAAPVPTVELSTTPADEGDDIAALYRSLKAMKLADALPIESRAPLAALLSILTTKNGTNV